MPTPVRVTVRGAALEGYSSAYTRSLVSAGLLDWSPDGAVVVGMGADRSSRRSGGITVVSAADGLP
jgi:hypothetical protein